MRIRTAIVVGGSRRLLSSLRAALLEEEPRLRVQAADSVEHALELCADGSAHCLVLAERGGAHDLLEELSALTRGRQSPPIVLLVRRVTKEVASRARDAGVGAVLPGRSGAAKFVAATVQCCAERVEERRLRDAVTKREALGRLAAGVAHDLNNLLFAMLGTLETLSREGGEGLGSWQKRIGDLLSAGEGAKRLVRQLTVYGSRRPGPRSAVVVNDVLRSSEILVRQIMGEDVSVMYRLDPRLEPVLAEATQVEEIVLNLVMNARDAMPEGGELTIETISASARRGDPERGSVATREIVLAVSDTGRGIEAAELEHVFDPYFTTKEHGTGIGLATVASLVEHWGGSVEVRSEVGEGTQFAVRLPVTAPVASGVGGGDEGSRALNLEALAGKRVLVVEDDTLVREVVRSTFESVGSEVFEADCASNAVAHFEERAGAFDLVVSDVILPGGSGLRLAQELHASWPLCRFVLMSGHRQEHLREKLTQWTGFCFLEKPIDRDRLLVAASQLFHGESA